MAPEARVLKIPRTDEESGYVLINAVSRGSKPLDLKLEATEGEEEYGHSLYMYANKIEVRHDKVGSLRIKNCPASESEWQEILHNIFQLEPQPEIKVTAAVQAGPSIALVVRKEIQGVTQRLGEINIGVAKDAGYNVLDWCATAVDFAADSKNAAKRNTTKIEELEKTVADLKQQLDDLITSKVDDETSLLSKFRDLLNEKKVKIREQQKIIASTSTDGNAASVSQSADQDEPVTSVEKGHKAGKSRAGKRKAKETAVKEEESTDDGFEPMEVEKGREEAEDTDPGDDTEATASTASDDEDDAQEAVEEEAQAAKPAARSQQSKPPAEKRERPPPPRALPFARSRPQDKAPAATSGGADSETESDDEL